MTSFQGGLSASGSKRMPFQLLARFWGPLLSAVARRTCLQAGLAALPVLHLLLGLPTKEFRYDLDGTKAEPYQGHAYTWPIPKPSPIWQLATDTMRAPYASTLRLYENGHPVGRPHTPHDDIASKRGGRTRIGMIRLRSLPETTATRAPIDTSIMRWPPRHSPSPSNRW
jgi:hypothetical protein